MKCGAKIIVYQVSFFFLIYLAFGIQQHKAGRDYRGISKLCRDNYQTVSIEIGHDIQILCRDTKEVTRNEIFSRQ